MKNLFFLACLLTVLLGCEKKEEYKKQKIADNSRAMADVALEKAPAETPETAGRTSPDVTRKIIKEGEINFETKNIAETRKVIYSSLQNLGGYIAAENEANDTADTRQTYILKARIPEKNFDRFLESVSANAARIDSKNIRAKDVTADYIDYTVQIANNKKLEDRYLELLKKGDKISDLLEIENKITQIQTTIDSTQGQLNYLLKQVEYSSLDITFYTKSIVKPVTQTFGTRLVASLSGGWDILGEIFFECLAIWPLWILSIFGYFGYMAWRKKHPVVNAPLVKQQ
jgi:hypothetical protein